MFGLDDKAKVNQYVPNSVGEAKEFGGYYTPVSFDVDSDIY